MAIMPPWQSLTENQTQAGGDFEVKTPPNKPHIQVSLVTTGTPTAGTLSILGKPMGTTSFIDTNIDIDMVNGPFIVLFSGYFDELQFSPSGFDGTDYDINIVASDAY